MRKSLFSFLCGYSVCRRVCCVQMRSARKVYELSRKKSCPPRLPGHDSIQVLREANQSAQSSLGYLTYPFLRLENNKKFQHYQRSWQSLIAQLKVKKKIREEPFFIITFFLGGRLANFHRFFFFKFEAEKVERDSSNEKEASKVRNSITASAFTTASIFSFHVVNGLRAQRMRV